jgi:5'(3')-deoxyribonucleotidase
LSVHELFEEAHKDARFWENLSVKPHCSEMMAFLDEHAPDWGILTSAWRHPQCYSGKFNWVKENLGRDVLKRLVIASGQKERLARKDAMLVDDRVDIINKWHEAGGATFHWIEYSNEQIENLSSQLEAWKQAVLEHQARTRYAIRNDH